MKRRIVLIAVLLSLTLYWTHNVSAQSQELNDSDLQCLVISMKQENHCGCVACCPTYSVSISGDGTVTYEGIAFVNAIGKQVYSISIDQVKELITEFYKVDFFSLKDKYTYIDNGDGTQVMIDHAPPVTTSITIKGKTKSVYNFFGAPEKLKGLQKKIYEISQVDVYVRHT
jgi:hypothetical protein